MSVPVELNLRYVYADVDRHGNVRIYFWRGKGHRKVRMREPVGSPAFHQRYGELMAGEALLVPALAPILKSNTFRWLCIQYFCSREFLSLDQRTQYVRRRILESMFDEPIFQGAKETFADFPLDRLTKANVEILRDRKEKFPEAANARVKALRSLFAFGLRKRYVASNVAKDVEYIRTNSDGWHTWSPQELAQYEQHHSSGTTARLAMDLLQYTGASRSDVTKLGPQSIRGNKLSYRRAKTGVEVELSMTDELREALATSPVVGTTTFLVT